MMTIRFAFASFAAGVASASGTGDAPLLRAADHLPAPANEAFAPNLIVTFKRPAAGEPLKLHVFLPPQPAENRPGIVFLGTKDQHVPVATAEDFAARMRAVGSDCRLVLYEGQPHSFFGYREGENPYFWKTLQSATGFLEELGWLVRESPPPAARKWTRGHCSGSEDGMAVSALPASVSPWSV